MAGLCIRGATEMTLYAIQQAVNEVAFDMMLQGVRIDQVRLAQLDSVVKSAMQTRLNLLSQSLGSPVNEKMPRSSKQIKELFASLGQRPGIDRKSGKETYNDETLFKIARQTPALRQVCYAILEFRQLGQMLSNFIRAKLDEDGRMRCSFNTAGPETFRWASSKNAFWRGCNLQNVTTGDRGLTGAKLPNLRTAVVPDPGCIMWEPDLAGADAQVVAWDSGDENLKQWFREGVKIHTITAKEVFGSAAGPDGRTEPYYTLAKKARHLWHYGGKARTMASSLGILVVEAERLMRQFAGLNPGIPKWHRRIDAIIRAKPHILTNRFGYRIVCFKRPEDELPDMLAWIGQGTVACIINRVLLNIRREVPHAMLLLNEHDSLVGQTPVNQWATVKPLLREQFLSVAVPYEEPLVIPPELKVSLKSWGEMEKEPW